MLACRQGQSVNSVPRSKVIERRARGQELQHPDQAVHYRTGLPVIVAQEDRKSADPFDQRSHIGFSVLLAELDEVAFPVAELFAPSDIRPVERVDVWAETPSVTAPGMLWPASGTMLPADVATA